MFNFNDSTASLLHQSYKELIYKTLYGGTIPVGILKPKPSHQQGFCGGGSQIDRLFNSGPAFPVNVKARMIREEPMLFQASWRFAREQGGPLTQRILNRIPMQRFMLRLGEKGLHPVIDTKSVMLMKGQYPCIPGWHTDSVPRGENGQPDFSKMNNGESIYLCRVGTAGCPTEYLQGTNVISYDPERVWGSIDEHLTKAFVSNPWDFERKIIPEGALYALNSPTLHRCCAAQCNGWRYFFRLSFTDKPLANEIRTQVQVYTDSSTGW